VSLGVGSHPPTMKEVKQMQRHSQIIRDIPSFTQAMEFAFETAKKGYAVLVRARDMKWEVVIFG
jgi:hypothetical protein